jgi:outer membrane lipoprotein
MAHHKILRFFLLGLFLILISGCAYPISRGLREEAREGPTFSMVLQDPTAYVGSIVLWGGRIIEAIPQPEGSELIVLETPLDYLEEPKTAKYSQGRFIAKSPRLLDPEVYQKGKKITLAGEIVGKETRPLDKTKYTYPVVLIKQIHLWRRHLVYVSPYPYYWYGPGWWGPWPYGYYGGWYDDDWDEDDWD